VLTLVDLECSYKKMEFMMDNITMDRKMDSENSNGKMEVYTLENGQIIKSQG